MSFLKKHGAEQKKMPKARNYKFYNMPQEYGLKDYKETEDYIVKRYSKIRNLIAIYTWGYVSIPGISDIDVVLVFDNREDYALPFSKRSFYFLNAKTRYLARHPFIFIDKDSFADIRYVYQNTDFRLLYGNSIKINKLSPLENYYSSIALLNDIIIRHYPRDFLIQFANRSINVRDTLLRLNSLKYTVKALESLTKEKNKNWLEKLELIEDLRKNWFEENNFDVLVMLNKNAIKMAIGIIERFQKFLIKNKIVEIISGNTVRYNGIKNKSLFVKEWSKDKALHDMIKNFKNKKKFYSTLPIELSAQLIEYSNYKGVISRYIKKNVGNHLDYQIKHKNVIENRINILNKQAELASKLKHSDFAAFFDFGYRNKSGLNNWVLSLLDKARF